MAADPRVDDCIKWQAPTFTFQGNVASFFPKSKSHASLMFHVVRAWIAWKERMRSAG